MSKLSFNNILQKTTLAQNLASKNCGYITFTFPDGMTGLGNRMYVYATFYGIARHNKKLPFIYEKGFELDNYFKISVSKIVDKFDVSKFSVDRSAWYTCCTFIPSLFDITCGSNFNVVGWRVSWKYFGKVENEIRREFTFVENISIPCAEVFQDVINQFNTTWRDSIVIGAHLRRGDLLQQKFLEYGMIPATKEYLHNAVNYFVKKFSDSNKKLIFIILGDDYNWNIENVPKVDNIKVMKPNIRTVDMCILSMCNHTIISTGTFGYWSAFLSGGIVTYMKDQCRPGSKFCSELKDEDYINPAWNWVPL